MSLKDIFNKENELLMFYHTTFRNVVSLTAVAFVALAFSNRYKDNKYLIFGELISIILLCSAIYLNYTLIKIFYVYKSYKYIHNYYKINLFMAIVHIILIILILIKLKKNLIN